MTNESIKFHFLPQDLEWLDNEIERIRGLIKEAKELGQESTEQSSESWHDNYNFEESQRQLKMFLNMLGGLSKAKENAVAVQMNPNPEEVEIGTTVRFRQQKLRKDGSLDLGKVDEFTIGSYMVSDALRDADFISYETPIARALLGAKIDQARRVTINREDYELTVLEIRPASIPSQ